MRMAVRVAADQMALVQNATQHVWPLLDIATHHEERGLDVSMSLEGVQDAVRDVRWAVVKGQRDDALDGTRGKDAASIKMWIFRCHVAQGRIKVGPTEAWALDARQSLDVVAQRLGRNGPAGGKEAVIGRGGDRLAWKGHQRLIARFPAARLTAIARRAMQLRVAAKAPLTAAWALLWTGRPTRMKLRRCHRGVFCP